MMYGMSQNLFQINPCNLYPEQIFFFEDIFHTLNGEINV